MKMREDALGLAAVEDRGQVAQASAAAEAGQDVEVERGAHESGPRLALGARLPLRLWRGDRRRGARVGDGLGAEPGVGREHAGVQNQLSAFAKLLLPHVTTPAAVVYFFFALSGFLIGQPIDALSDQGAPWVWKSYKRRFVRIAMEIRRTKPPSPSRGNVSLLQRSRRRPAGAERRPSRAVASTAAHSRRWRGVTARARLPNS
jgi:hypothetical protein